MSNCCDPLPYQRLFDDKEARRKLRRYRRSGLDATAEGIAGYLKDRGVTGRSLLEVGGGIGDFQVELLKAGAVSSVNVELSDGYESAASELMKAEGLSDRMGRRLGDFVEEQDLVSSADVVILNRVICCYPWMGRLMDAATGKTDWLLAIAVPRDRLLERVLVAAENAINRLRNSGFRAFVHPITDIERRAMDSGMHLVYRDRGFIWQGLVFERS